jgi:hypothetical protein
MRYTTLRTLVISLVLAASANSAVVTFSGGPFPDDFVDNPGVRQVIGGEPIVSFDPAADVFAFDPATFGISQIAFANDVASNLPASGVNTIVLQSLDNDNDPVTPFGAGSAANLIAAQVTSSGPGFFIYFNSGLDLPRLVYSTDLSDNTADLKILARISNLAGNPGALGTFNSANFVATPEPSTAVLMSITGALWACSRVVRRRRTAR